MLAEFTLVAWVATAAEHVVQIEALGGALRVAGVADALVDGCFTLQPHKAWSTLAGEAVQFIHTGATVLAGLGGTVINGVLAGSSSVASVTGAPEAVHLVQTLGTVQAGVGGTVVFVNVTLFACPARVTDTLVLKELIHADTVGTWSRLTKIHLDVAPLPCEATGTVTAEVMDKICAVGIQQARNVSTVIDIGLTKATLPACLTLAAEASLFQRHADGIIGTRVTLLRARVDSDVTVGTCVPRTAQALIRLLTRVVFAHSAVRTGVLYAFRLLVLALQATVAVLTLTIVTLWKVDAGATVEARL